MSRAVICSYHYLRELFEDKDVARLNDLLTEENSQRHSGINLVGNLQEEFQLENLSEEYNIDYTLVWDLALQRIISVQATKLLRDPEVRELLRTTSILPNNLRYLLWISD